MVTLCNDLEEASDFRKGHCQFNFNRMKRIKSTNEDAEERSHFKGTLLLLNFRIASTHYFPGFQCELDVILSHLPP